MSVLPGPTFTIDDSSSPPPPAHDTDRQNYPDEDGSVHWVTVCPQFFAGNSLESSSSIGTPDDSGDEEEGEEEEVHSKLNRGLGLDSLDSLQESIPIKKGLSEHIDGKSKSFSDLSQVSSVKELQKHENPFNKRRRVLMSSKWSRRSAFYTWSNPKSMPLLPLHENEQEVEENCRKLASPSSLSSSSSSSLAEDKKQEDQMQQLRQKTVPESTRLKPGSFKPRSFSLADLKEHDNEEDD